MRPTLALHTVGLRVEVQTDVTKQALYLRAADYRSNAACNGATNAVYHGSHKTDASVVYGSGVVEGKIAGQTDLAVGKRDTHPTMSVHPPETGL